MWVLQSNLVKDAQVRSFEVAFQTMNLSFIKVAIKPFSDGFIDEPRLPHTEVIPYGSTTLMRIALQRGWSGLFYNDAFQVPIWSIHRRDMLNGDADVMTAREAGIRFSRDDQERRWFIRPTEDFKAFSGIAAPARELARLMTSGEGSTFGFTPDTTVAVSKPKIIRREWRYFVVAHQIVSGSVYRVGGEQCVYREDDQGTLREAAAMAKDWLPHDTCVMDVAETEDGNRVVEFNCLNASGLYDHDVPAIVRAVSDRFRG
jgi:hypothetical protein